MRPKAYRKRPVEIEAVQIECLDYDGMYEIIDWINDNGGEAFAAGPDPLHPEDYYNGDEESEESDIMIGINTLEGTMYASCGDFIIKGIAGEFYPCKPDIFVKTYEFVWG